MKTFALTLFILGSILSAGVEDCSGQNAIANGQNNMKLIQNLPIAPNRLQPVMIQSSIANVPSQGFNSNKQLSNFANTLQLSRSNAGQVPIVASALISPAQRPTNIASGITSGIQQVPSGASQLLVVQQKPTTGVSKSSTVSKTTSTASVSAASPKTESTASSAAQETLSKVTKATSSVVADASQSARNSPKKAASASSGSGKILKDTLARKSAKTVATTKIATTKSVDDDDSMLGSKLDHAWEGDTKVIVAPKTTDQVSKSSAVKAAVVSSEQVDTTDKEEQTQTQTQEEEQQPRKEQQQQPESSTASLKPINAREDFQRQTDLDFNSIRTYVRQLLDSLLRGEGFNVLGGRSGGAKQKSQTEDVVQSDNIDVVAASFDQSPEQPVPLANQKLSGVLGGKDSVVTAQLNEKGPTDFIAKMRQALSGNSEFKFA